MFEHVFHDCDLYFTKCAFCDEWGMRRHIKGEHYATVHRQIECHWCGEFVRLEDLEDHLFGHIANMTKCVKDSVEMASRMRKDIVLPKVRNWLTHND